MADSIYFAGADVGTSGCRVSIYSDRGALAASAANHYRLHTLRPGWVEQDPEEIVRVFHTTVEEALAHFEPPRARIRAFVLGTTLHNIFPVSRDGQPIHPMLTWADARAEPQLAEIRSTLDPDALYSRTGCPLHAMYPLAKLLWFRRERPDLFAKAARFVSIKEFLIFRLTGRWVVDRSTTSGTGFFNIHKLEWDAECLHLLDLEPDRLSPHSSTTEAIYDWPASSLGLPGGAALVVGAGDGVLSTLGAGAIGPHQYTVMIGTSGAVRRAVPAPRTDPVVKNWCYNLTDSLWVVGGAINNGGLALQWLKDNLVSQPYEDLEASAAQVPVGSLGLLFLPFLSGERSPHWNSNARGVLFGLTLNHGKPELVRATLEGVLFSLYSVFVRLRRLDPDPAAVPAELRASGAVTRSSIWLQMMADVFGLPIVCPAEPEGTAFGAAALGMLATGYLSRPEAIGQLLSPPRAVFAPDGSRHEQYQLLFALYEKLYVDLVADFDQISAIQNARAEG